MKLLSYKFQSIFAFGEGEYKTIYELTVLKIKLFGLIKIEEKIKYEISMFESISEHEKHWDKLIRTGAIINQ